MNDQNSLRKAEGEIDSPFPGLRPFAERDSQLFFGRDEQIEELLDCLTERRFVAVTGDSGCGKSSLVRAGLVPMLRLGYLAGAASEWKVAMFRPGSDPIGNLAASLGKSNLSAVRAKLDYSSLGLLDAAQSILSPNENLLLVVDQFEEIFRFEQEERHSGDTDPAAAFVKLILNAVRQNEVPIYVISTMRSDFLSACTIFRGLPEALNGGQYLVPRMIRSQQKIAIEGPIALAGASITSRLVQRLLNDLGDDPDQLPILQHALMRMWERSRASRDMGDPIDLSHYESVGKITNALDQHAEEVYRRLSPEEQTIARKIFQRLTETHIDERMTRRVTRRPTELSKLIEVTGENREKVLKVIEILRAPGCAFLTSSEAGPLLDHSMIDISHESLIRLWRTAQEWADAEARSAEIYKMLASSALSKRVLYRDQDLLQAQEWQEKTKPGPAWAESYRISAQYTAQSEFNEAMNFLERSEQMAKAEEEKKEKQQAAEKRKEEEKRREEQRQSEMLGERRGKRAGGKISIIAIGLVIVLVIVSLTALHIMTQQQEVTAIIAKHMAAEANLLLQQKAYEASALLAMESMRRIPLSEDLQTIRDSLEFLRKPVSVLSQESPVLAVAFSPDSRRIVIGAKDKTARVFDLSSSEELYRFRHGDAVADVTFSRDGRWIATASFDGTARVFDAATGQGIRSFDEKGPVVKVAFNSDGLKLATASYDGTARIFDIQSGAEVLNHKLGGMVMAIAWNSDDRFLACAGVDKSVRVVQVSTRKEIFAGRFKNSVTSVAFSPDSHTVAAGSRDNTARIFDVANGREVRRLAHSGPVLAVTFSPDGTRLGTGSIDNAARVFDVSSGSEVAKLVHQGWVDSVAFNKDGRLLVTGSYDNTMRLLDVDSNREVARIQHRNVVREVVFSPDGRRFASASDDQTSRIFETARTRELARLEHPKLTFALALSPDHRLMALAGTDRAGTDNMMRVSEVLSGREVLHLSQTDQVPDLFFGADNHSMAIAGYKNKIIVVDVNTGVTKLKASLDGPVNTVALSSDGRYLAAGSDDHSARVFEISSGKTVMLQLHPNPVLDVAFSTDGRFLATTDGGRAARVFDVRTTATIGSFDGENGVRTIAFDSAGRRLATGGDDKLRIFKVATREQLWSLSLTPDKIKSISFSPDDKWVAIVTDDGTARVLDSADGKQIARLNTGGRIRQAGFTTDGRYLDIVPEESDLLWVERLLLRPDDLFQAICSTVTRNLTSEEWKRYLQDEPYKKTCPNLP